MINKSRLASLARLFSRHAFLVSKLFRFSMFCWICSCSEEFGLLRCRTYVLNESGRLVQKKFLLASDEILLLRRQEDFLSGVEVDLGRGARVDGWQWRFVYMLLIVHAVQFLLGTKTGRMFCVLQVNKMLVLAYACEFSSIGTIFWLQNSWLKFR